jgi:hypothetical protein
MKTCLPSSAQAGDFPSSRGPAPANPACVRRAQAGGFDASLTECGEKLLAILIVAEDGLAPISAIHDVCPAVALAKADGK